MFVVAFMSAEGRTRGFLNAKINMFFINMESSHLHVSDVGGGLDFCMYIYCLTLPEEPNFYFPFHKYIVCIVIFVGFLTVLKRG